MNYAARFRGRRDFEVRRDFEEICQQKCIGLNSLSLLQLVQFSSQKPLIDSVLHEVGPVNVNHWNVMLVLIIPVLV